jgi:hypothetical protein
MTIQFCQRCHKPITNIEISIFEFGKRICSICKEKEELHPAFDDAEIDMVYSVANGKRLSDYTGVGLPEEVRTNWQGKDRLTVWNKTDRRYAIQQEFSTIEDVLRFVRDFRVRHEYTPGYYSPVLGKRIDASKVRMVVVPIEEVTVR